MKKRCVIIGSGLGGLSCGVILARNGYDVTVLEQDARIGGCLQCFRRGDAKFETGMHFIGSCDEGQVLRRLLRYLEVFDDLRLSRLDPSGYEVISLGGEHFRLAQGREAFIEELAARFPAERGRLNDYFDLIGRIARASSLHALQSGTSDLGVLAEYQMRSIDSVLDALIRDPLLRDVLVGNLPLYAAEKGRTPFATHAFITDFYNRGLSASWAAATPWPSRSHVPLCAAAAGSRPAAGLCGSVAMPPGFVPSRPKTDAAARPIW